MSLEEKTAPEKKVFRYHCSFCWRELKNNSIRYKGIGACATCFKVAEKLINGIREYQQNRSSNLGVRA